MGLRETWASLGKWERRSALLGLALMLAAGGMYADTLARPEHYREQWAEHRDRMWAETVHALLRPGEKPASSGSAADKRDKAGKA